MDWGPAAWKFLHSVTFAYPDKPTLSQKRDIEQFFYNLKTLLPCEECKIHFEKEILRHPPDSNSKLSISTWLVDIHNRINRRLGKKHFTYEEAIKEYHNNKCVNCAEKPISKNSFAKFIFMIFIVIGILLYLKMMLK